MIDNIYTTSSYDKPKTIKKKLIKCYSDSNFYECLYYYSNSLIF